MKLPTKPQEQGETPAYEAKMHSKKFLAQALRKKSALPADQKPQYRPADSTAD
jgi:hypothetical protein